MGRFSPNTKGRAWLATIHIANMENAGLEKDAYENPEDIADFFIELWRSSGKDRTSGVAVCVSEKGLYHLHMALYGNTTTLSNVSKILFNSHVEPQLGGKKELTDYLNKSGKYAEKGEIVLYTKGLDAIQDNQGNRSDLVEIESYLQEGLKPEEIFELSFRFRRFEKQIKAQYISLKIKSTPLIKDMQNEYHVGDAVQVKPFTIFHYVRNMIQIIYIFVMILRMVEWIII